MESKGKPISEFIEKYFLHFNAGTLVDAAKAYESHLSSGGKMMITLAGAMSTAELGKILAQMIREDKVHIITCTGANLEEDVMNLIAHKRMKKVPNYRDLTAEDEQNLLDQKFNRVTDTCIPGDAMTELRDYLYDFWKEANEKSQRFFPHEFFYKLLLSNKVKVCDSMDPADSWLLAAAHKNLPIIVPGWEDSSMGNIFVTLVMKNELNMSTTKSGLEYMKYLADWYMDVTKNLDDKNPGIGFFQIGGGIAGDFPICVVPMLSQDLGIPTKLWGYFCQISDSTTSYGSYSGAVPNEKITWGKLGVKTPSFVIESDATIVAPLIFAYVLGK